MKVMVINGPNINMLGVREKEIYGNESYASLCQRIEVHCKEKNIEAEIYQSNHEGDLVDKIQSAYNQADGIIINPAAYTHTSIAILDALKSVAIPAVEVHISDVSAREKFRQTSFAGMACVHSIIGHGLGGYLEAIDYLADICD